MSKHIETKHKLKSIPDVVTFENILEASTLTDDEKNFIRMYYLRGNSLSYIADTMGFSPVYARQKHRELLDKLSYFV